MNDKLLKECLERNQKTLRELLKHVYEEGRQEGTQNTILMLCSPKTPDDKIKEEIADAIKYLEQAILKMKIDYGLLS